MKLFYATKTNKIQLRLAAVCVASLLAFGNPDLRAADAWVDTHAHLIYMAGRGSERPAAADYRNAAVKLMEEMDRRGVARAIILSPPGTRKPGRGIFFTDLIQEALKAGQGRLYFLGGGDTLNPMIQTYAPEKVTSAVRSEFEREAEALVRKGAHGFGEMAALHLSMHEGHPFEQVAPDHPLFLLLADIAARHGLPIDLHMDAVPADMAFPAAMERLSKFNPAQLKGNVDGLTRLLAHNRKAAIVWQHAGTDPLYGMNAARLRKMLQEHPNLYVGLRLPFEQPPARPPMLNSPIDPSGAIKPDWLALFSDYPDRFMIGNDIFVQDEAKYGPDRAQNKIDPYAVFSMIGKLPAQLRAKIGGANAARVYGLK